MPSLSDPAVASVLSEGRQAHVAMRTRAGIHVTPQLYAWNGDGLGVFAAAPTLKARVLRTGDPVGVLVGNGARWVAVTGRVGRFDPLNPFDGARAVLDARRTVPIVAGFVLRNAVDLVAFGRDAVLGRTGRRLPPRRVLLTIEPVEVTAFEDAEVGDAVVGWDTPDGPVAIPARWDGEAERAELSSAFVADAGLPERAAACFTRDDYGGAGPAAKSGVLLRGDAVLEREGDGWVAVLDPERVTTWDGVETETAKA
jgi:hypothetical protein